MKTAQVTTETVSVAVSDGTQMPVYVARPAAGSAGRGLLVFQEAFGVNAHIRRVTERFAEAGYAAAAPALYHRTDATFQGSYGDFSQIMPHMQAVTDAGMSADVTAAFDWLQSSAAAQAVGCVGYCMGGRASFLADAVVPIRAAVSYYGGGIAPNPRGPGLLDRTPGLHAPILLFWGGKDTHIPIEQTRAVEDELRAAGKPYTQVTFSEADHGFFCDERPSYNADAAAQSWAMTLEFFRQRIG